MGISIWQLLIILAIVMVLFGTKKLRNVGGDLGAAIRNFKNAVSEGENEKKEEAEKLEQKDKVIEGEATREKDKV
jgi:sec-independent protein translocase protein TatA